MAQRPFARTTLRSSKTLKPLSALSFKIGEKRGVGYFVNNANQCKLVLTFAEEPNWDRRRAFQSRAMRKLPAGASTRYNPTEGKALEFACRGDASAMSVREIERVVAK